MIYINIAQVKGLFIDNGLLCLGAETDDSFIDLGNVKDRLLAKILAKIDI